MTFLLRLIFLGTALGANAANSDALTKRLLNASDASSLDDVAMKPWHLKMDVQLYDEKGKPTEAGTLEEWWARDKDKRVYETPSYKTTEIRTKGAIYRSKDQLAVPYLLNAIREEAVHPMPSDREIESSKPTLKVEPFSNLKLDCVVLGTELSNDSFFSPALTSRYCLAQTEDLLRASYRYASEISSFQ